jgi:hypothetical protein
MFHTVNTTGSAEADAALLRHRFAEFVQQHFTQNDGATPSAWRWRETRADTDARSLLGIECPATGALRSSFMDMIAQHAPCHRGLPHPCPGDFLVVSLPDAEAAVRLAVSLQQIQPEARLRMGIVHADRAADLEQLACRAAPSCVQLAPEVYAAVEDFISDQLGSCLVMTEIGDGVLIQAALALPPAASAELSTFAGLGLM